MEKPTFHEISKTPVPDNIQSLIDSSISDPSSNKHICEICKAEVPHERWHYHIYKHSGFKPFLCACGSRFSTAIGASRHRRNAYPCLFCRRSFLRKDAWTVHQMTCSLAEPAIRDKMFVSKNLRSVTLLDSTGESIVGAYIRNDLTETSGSKPPTPLSYEIDRHISGAAGMSSPWQIVLLKVKDVDGKHIDIPLYEHLSWQKLCNLLVEKQVLAKGHLSSGDCVVYTQDGRVLFDQEWENWIAEAISSYSEDMTPTHLQVELRIVRKSCCEKLSEQDQDVCNGCSTPLIDMDFPFLNLPDAIELVPFPSTPLIEMTDSIPDASHPIATSVKISFNSENALVRRRKQQPSSEESGEEQRSSPLQYEDQNVDSRNNTLHRAVRALWTLYLYLIKPPFIAPPCTLNDRFHRENLDFHLSFLQTWILGIDICLLGGTWAVSDLTTASRSPILQTFVQLSASFAFFGIVFGLLLSYTIGIMEKNWFVQWVNQNMGNRSSERRVSVWNPIIMLNLPLTWTAWAILNTVVFVLLYAWIIDPSGDPSIATNIPGAFTSFVIGWSVFYVYMIQREISRCRLYPREEVV